MKSSLTISIVMTDLDRLRKQIAAGEYKLDAASIAGALLDYACVNEPAPPGDLTRPAERSGAREAPGRPA